MKHSTIVTFFEEVTSPISQIIMLLITFSLVVLIAYPPYEKFNSFEKKPEIFGINASVLQEWGAEPAEVMMGLHIQDFPEFDVINDKFTFSGFVWFKFDPAQVSYDAVDKFVFAKGKIVQKSNPDTWLEGNNLFVKYLVRVEFKTDLNYQSFPLDDHSIYISVVNKFVMPEEVIFRSSIQNFTISPAIYLSGWELVNSEVNYGYSKALLKSGESAHLERYPTVIFSFDIKRFGIQGIMLIFLPLFIVCFIALFALSFDPEKQGSIILGLSSTGIASLVAYRFVIQSISPHVGYFMLSDQIFILFLAFLFAIFMFSMILVRYKKLTNTLAVIRGIVFLLFHVAFLAWWYYLLYWWV